MELYNSINIYKFAVRIIPMKPNMQSFETLRRYEDPKTGRVVLEVDDLEFLKNPKHGFNWFQRHIRHHWLKWALRHSDVIIAADRETAFDIHRFYFIPSERISVRP